MVIHRVAKLMIFAAWMAGVTGMAPWAGAVPSPGDPHSTAYLGVMVDNVAPTTAASLHLKDGSGAVITGVDQDGPACRAGLKSGDIVTAFNGKPVEGGDQFASLIHSSAAGTVVSMTVIRDGQSKEMKVTLGDWKQMAGMPGPPLAAAGRMAFAPPPPPPPPLPPRMYPDVEVPNFTPISLRNGIAVEPLSPQLCDFFGVPQNKGVLVRSVEKGSRGEKAGFHAGDVVVKVNGQPVHDTSDFTHALRSSPSRAAAVTVMREKREQNLTLTLPEKKDSGSLREDSFDVPDITAETEQAINRAGDEIARITPAIMEKVQQTLTLTLHSRDIDLRDIDKKLQDLQRKMQDRQQEMQQKLRRELSGEWTEI